MSIAPEAIAAQGLREWLLANMPAACATVNAARAAVLKTPTAGPFTVPASAVLKLSFAGRDGAVIAVPLTTGTRSAALVASDINAVVANVATVDEAGRLVIRSATAPSFGPSLVNSAVVVARDATGANAALGLDAGGEYSITTPVTPPGLKGVCDGMPTGGFFEPSQMTPGRVLVTIGDRTSALTEASPRRYEWTVDLEVAVFRTEAQNVTHQSREGIQAALQAVRECWQTDAGRQLGRGGFGDVQLCMETSTRISPWSFQQQRSGQQPGGLLFDAVNLKLRVRVFQQPNP